MQLDEKYIRHERIKVGDERMKKVILKDKNQQTVEAVDTSIPLNKEKVGKRFLEFSFTRTSFRMTLKI